MKGKTMNLPRCTGALCAFLALNGGSALAQGRIPVPEASPRASVSQTVGIAEVEVSYHRPGVKGRPIWGALVPYGEVWRAGANENTTVRFSQPVRVAGRVLAAGTYGLHMIPGKETWTVIFSTNATSWGSFFYRESEDALRVTVTPEAAPMAEWLRYEFSDLTDSSALLALSWEKLRVSVPLAFDTRDLILRYIRYAYLRGEFAFGWQGFNNAAQYCLRNNINLPEALTWAEKSIALAENFSNLRTRASILEKLGRGEEAAELRTRSLALASESDLNQLGYTSLQAGRTPEAIEIFRRNVRAHPDSWNVYDSLAEGLEKSGDTRGAIGAYEKALSLVKDPAQQKRIAAALAKLRTR